MKNKIIIISITLIIILIGIILYITLNNKNDKVVNENNKVENTEKELQDKTIKNEINKKLCYENLCTDNIKITMVENLGAIVFELKNTSNETIKAGGFKLVLSYNGEYKDFIVYHDDILANETYPVSIAIDDKKIVNSKSYSFEKADHIHTGECKH